MAFSYKIRAFNQTLGSVQISVHNDANETIDNLNIDLPRDAEGLYLTGTPLNDYIMGFLPADFYTQKEQIKAGVANASAIEALVEALPSEEPDDVSSEVENNTYIDNRLKHHGLIS